MYIFYTASYKNYTQYQLSTEFKTLCFLLKKKHHSVQVHCFILNIVKTIHSTNLVLIQDIVYLTETIHSTNSVLIQSIVYLTEKHHTGKYMF